MDETRPISRIEHFLAAITGEDAELPTPQTRVELFLAVIAGGTYLLPEPQSRWELYLARILGQDVELPVPVSRDDRYLAAIAGMEGAEAPAFPISRVEMYLAEWAAQSGAQYETVTGAIASFTTVRSAPLRKLSVALEPIQSGTGDPSPDNVRPITGHSALTVYTSGKNLMPVKDLDGLKAINTAGTWSGNVYTQNGVTFEVNADGTIHVSAENNSASSAFVLTGAFDVKPGGYKAYSGVLSGGSNAYGVQIFRASDNATYATTGANGQTSAINLSSQVAIKARIFVWSGQTLDEVFKPMLCFKDETDTAFEPYTGTTIPISIPTPPGTVYGGTLDVVSGVLTVDRAFLELQNVGQNIWNLGAQGTSRFTFNPTNYGGRCVPGSTTAQIICSHIPTGQASLTQPFCRCNTGAQIIIQTGNAEIVTVADLVAWLNDQKTANTPVEICFALETPLTYQLTPQEVSALLGENNVWSDSGDVTVEYRSN